MAKHRGKRKRSCPNRAIRNAINALSGYVHGHRTPPARARSAAHYLGSCDLITNSGRRGWVTRGNTSAALRLMAGYEKKSKKRLTRLGGFSRKLIEAAKKIMR